MSRQIEYYRSANGHSPVQEWLSQFNDLTVGRIRGYIRRVGGGGAKNNIRFIGDGVFEIKINIGPGYRVYFGLAGRTIMLLLAGGDKSTQHMDIKKAKEYWREYESKNGF